MANPCSQSAYTRRQPLPCSHPTRSAPSAGSWASFNLLSLGQAPSFLRLLPGSTGGHTYFISYRTAVGCDRSLDQQYNRKVGGR